jgi:hypothetical protein
VTGDRRVNVTDFGAIATLIGVTVDRTNPAHVRCDLDGNGTINQADLMFAMTGNGVDLRAAVNPCGAFLRSAPRNDGGVASADASVEVGPPAAATPSAVDRLVQAFGTAHGDRGRKPVGDGGASDAFIVGARVQLGDLIASLPRDTVLPGLFALRSTPERLAIGGAVTAQQAADAFALVTLGEVDGWLVCLAPAEQNTPASLAVTGAMLVASGLDVGIVVHAGDGWAEVVGPDIVVRFRGGIPQDWQQRVVDSFGGFVVTPLAAGEWMLESQTRFGGDAWKVLRSLERRRDVEAAQSALTAGAAEPEQEEAP